MLSASDYYSVVNNGDDLRCERKRHQVFSQYFTIKPSNLFLFSTKIYQSYNAHSMFGLRNQILTLYKCHVI